MVIMVYEKLENIYGKTSAAADGQRTWHGMAYTTFCVYFNLHLPNEYFIGCRAAASVRALRNSMKPMNVHFVIF